MYHDPRLENRYHAWLLIADFACSPDEITNQIGLEPTETRVKGEYRTIGKKKPHKLRNTDNTWVVKSELPNTTPLEEQLQYLLDKIEPYKENIIKASKKYKVGFNTAIYYYEANPGFNLDKDLLEKINKLHLGIYIDIYFLAGTHSQFEYPEVEAELTKQFSILPDIAKFNKDGYNEANSLAKSLIGIDEAVHNLEMYMEDLVIWDDLSEELFKEKFERVNENLRGIMKNIEKSKYLTSEIKESKNNKS